MKTFFPKLKNHRPKYFIIDATNLLLGRLATGISTLLRGKETSIYTPSINLGNFVCVINASKIIISGKKLYNKIYYTNSQRPGSLKIENFKDLQTRIPARILENAVRGMLPKNILGRQYFNRLFVFKNELKINNLTSFSKIHWINTRI